MLTERFQTHRDLSYNLLFPHVWLNEQISGVVTTQLVFLVYISPGLKVIKLFSYSAQLKLQFILLINVIISRIVGILTFTSRISNML